MSYLRGPLTREQIKLLVEPIKRQQTTAVSPQPSPSGLSSVSSVSPADLTRTREKPMIPPDIPEYFVPYEQNIQEGKNLAYQPMIVGASCVRFFEPKAKVDITKYFLLSSVTNLYQLIGTIPKK